MNPNDWIEIKPGCKMPSDGERVLVAEDGAWIQAIYRDDEDFAGFYSTTGACLTPTHWLPVVQPLSADSFKEWWETQKCEFVTRFTMARSAWNAGVEHERKKKP